MKAVRGVVLISLATALGQAALVAVMPLIARLYTPADMGMFAVFGAAIGLAGTTVALHYELAIPLPRFGRDVRSVTWLSILTSMAVATSITLVLSFGSGDLLVKVGAGSLQEVWYLIPVALMMIGIVMSLSYYSVKRESYGRNAASKCLQPVTQAVGQCVAGYWGHGWLGLVGGQLAGIVAGLLPLVDCSLWSHRSHVRRNSISRVWLLARKYRNFPMYSAPASLLNAACSNVPALLLANFFGLQVAGFYGLSIRVLQLPARLLGQSISQIFLARSAEAARTSDLGKFVEPVFRSLMAMSIHVFIPMLILAGPVFTLAFGPTWRESALYVQLLMPWVLAAFVASPMSMLVAVCQKQRQEWWFQSGYLIIGVLALFCGALLSSPRLSLALFSGLCALLLGGKVWWLLGLAGCDRRLAALATARELLLACLANTPIGFLLTTSVSPVVSSILGLAWALVIQWVNFAVRRVYALKKR